MYDSGILALSRQQAIYRYVTSIDMVIPINGDRKKLTKQLNTLIRYGHNFIGQMSPDEVMEFPEQQRWEKMVENTTQKYEDFYVIRSKILHGAETITVNNIERTSFSDEEVQTIRQLAHNAIRVMAFLARDFNWQTYEDAEKWFKNPCDLPSYSQNPV